MKPPSLIQIEEGDRQLLAGIAASMAEAAQRSGEWLICRPGCTPCCMGPFGITRLDAMRLGAGMADLQASDPARAAAVRARATAYIALIAPLYPGDPDSGKLEDENQLGETMEDEPCPALDRETGRCDLYEARPVTCRTFGPATRIGEGTYGACELCYEGATDDEMAQCAVESDPQGLEAGLLRELAKAGEGGMTIVAYALVRALSDV